jgi:valyl-tRNA synthetase
MTPTISKWKRHNLEMISVIDEDGRMTAAAGSFQGMDRFELSSRGADAARGLGPSGKSVDHPHNVGHCDRCKTVVEPALSTQWFVKMQPLAEPAIQAVEDGRIRFVPENWAKTYFEWMRNIRDWCISRQLWWGHRIPAWYCQRCGEINVARETPTRCSKCGHRVTGHRCAGYLVQFRSLAVLYPWLAGRD